MSKTHPFRTPAVLKLIGQRVCYCGSILARITDEEVPRFSRNTHVARLTITPVSPMIHAPRVNQIASVSVKLGCSCRPNVLSLSCSARAHVPKPCGAPVAMRAPRIAAREKMRAECRLPNYECPTGLRQLVDDLSIDWIELKCNHDSHESDVRCERATCRTHLYRCV